MKHCWRKIRDLSSSLSASQAEKKKLPPPPSAVPRLNVADGRVPAAVGRCSLQAVVIQQDSFMEDQRQALSERSSSCSSLSRQQSSRPSSLIEQEKQRSLEKQRQELASLQRQQAAHAEEKRRREREWDLKERQLSEREGLLRLQVTLRHLLAGGGASRMMVVCSSKMTVELKSFWHFMTFSQVQ